MAKPDEDIVEIALPVPAALLARVDAMAAATGRGRAEIIADAIVLVVAEHEERVAGEAARPEGEGEGEGDAGGESGGPTYFSGG